MTVRLLFLALPAVLLSVSPAAAQSNGCTGFPPTTLDLDTVLAPIQRDDALSIPQLTRLPGRTPGPVSTTDSHVLGLTQARYGEQSQVSALFKTMGDGTYCASASKLAISFGFQQRIVHVAREIPAGSCLHGEVLAHEMRHVAVDEALLQEMMPQIRSRLDQVIAEMAPVRSRSQSQAMAAVRRPLESAMRRIMQEFGRERDRRQAQVDTVEEYERVSRVCNGEARNYLPKPATRRTVRQG
ncbi:hypothetical protein GBZ48_15660 [Azospirillum melinis]|uniref:DUF922 domain-containing protein n=1 Tax=Azospirillum melinis TaxID=328839 RepID=A0ABX2KDG0_9PROT|nr:hypothetical protein [Azospirillum melinis]MBP2303807.1 hypothetical protein [Azospirillum melinis]NUB00718.1 hypothetical protein [Azospirillum melinis]